MERILNYLFFYFKEIWLQIRSKTGIHIVLWSSSILELSMCISLVHNFLNFRATLLSELPLGCWMYLFMGWLARERTFLLQELVKYISFCMHDGDRLMARETNRAVNWRGWQPTSSRWYLSTPSFFFSQLNYHLPSRDDNFLHEVESPREKKGLGSGLGDFFKSQKIVWGGYGDTISEHSENNNNNNNINFLKIIIIK